MTTETAKIAPKTASKAKQTAEAATEATGERMAQYADSAREMVQRAADVAKKRTDNAYETVEGFNSGVEIALTRAVKGYMSILTGIANVSHENVRHMLATVEKASEAKSLTEAAQIQVDFVRESATQNFEHARSAYETARDVVVEETETLRTRAADMWKGEKTAA